MAYEIPGNGWTLEAAANFAAKQFYFIYIDTNGRAALTTSDGQRAAGVIQNNPPQYGAVTVVSDGIVKVVSNGSIEAGKPVSAANGGKAKEAATTEYIMGYALEGDGAVDGTIISVRLATPGAMP